MRAVPWLTRCRGAECAALAACTRALSAGPRKARRPEKERRLLSSSLKRDRSEDACLGEPPLGDGQEGNRSSDQVSPRVEFEQSQLEDDAFTERAGPAFPRDLAGWAAGPRGSALDTDAAAAMQRGLLLHRGSGRAGAGSHLLRCARAARATRRAARPGTRPRPARACAASRAASVRRSRTRPVQPWPARRPCCTGRARRPWWLAGPLADPGREALLRT